jgi:hypothetical protein
LFNPSATHAITNDYVKSISQGLRDSKTIGDRDLLRQIQNEYLTTHLTDFSQVGQFNRLNPKKLSNLNSSELDRAKSLLDDKQFKALEDVIEASKMLAEAEVYGKKSKTSDELKRASTSVIKESWYAVADLIKRRNYDAATEAILNPTAFKDKKMIQGQWIEQLGKGVQRAALPATNVLMQTAQPSREQNQMNQGGRMNPSDILQFAPQN